jgi:hypothetical protein
MIRVVRYALVSGVLVLLLSSMSSGQQNAVVQGTVFDVKGAPLPSVQVVLQNPQIGVERHAVTDKDGAYTFTDVAPLSGYVITASAPGHQFKSRTFDLQVSQRYLTVPPIEEQEVTSATVSPLPRPNPTKPSPTVPIESLSTAEGTVITQSDLRSLPLYNRNFLTLGLLAIGTHEPQGGSNLSGASFSISGARLTSNNFLLDGMDNVASSTNQAIPFQVNDAIQEFRVTSSAPDAQFGRNIGGVVNVVTQRATSSFHGSVFGFFGSDALNAGNPLSVYSNSGFAQAAAYAGTSGPIPTNTVTNSLGTVTLLNPTSYNQLLAANTSCTGYCTPFNPAAIAAGNKNFTQPFSSQQFGINAGGSFFKVRKLFLFGDYEGTRINNPNPVFDRVPNALDMNPSVGGPDAQLAQNILKLYPAANVTTNGQAGALAFFKGEAPNYTNVDNYMVRMDFNQSSNSNWTARYNIQDLHQLHDDQLPSSSTYPGDGSNRSALNQSLILSFTHVFSPNVTNEARGGFTRFQVIETPQDANFNAASVGLPSGELSSFLLSGLDPRYFGAYYGQNPPNTYTGWNTAYWTAPNLSTRITPSLDGLFPFPRIGAPLYAPGQNRDTTGYVADNVSWVHGPHSMRFGVEYRKLQNVFINDAFARGYVVSGDIGEFTSDSETGLFGNSGLGAPYGSAPSYDYSVKQNLAYRGLFNSYAVAAYAQDSWRVTPHLTINAGLRFEDFSAPTETNNQIWNYNPSANGLVQQGSNKVFDPFGYQCGVSVVNGVQYSQLDSVYPSRTAQLPWNCQATAANNLFNRFLGGIEPRFGVAWSNAEGTLVVRGGFGWYYDQLPMSSVAQLMFNRPTPLNTTNPQATYGQSFTSAYCPTSQCGMGNSSLTALNPDKASSQVASIPFGVTALARNFTLPYTRQVNFSVQNLITPKLSLELGYVGQFSQNLTTTTNTGYNNEWWCTASAGAKNPVPGSQFNPNCDTFSYLPVFTVADNGHGSYNSLIAQVHFNQWHGLQLNASYVWSKSLDNSSVVNSPLVPTSLMTQSYGLQFFGLGNPSAFGLGQQVSRLTSGSSPGFCTQCNGFSFGNPANLGALVGSALTTTGAGQVFVSQYNIPQSPYNSLANDYGPSDFNMTNRLVINYAWNIPTKSRSVLLNGWTVTGIILAEGGQPYTIFAGPVYGELTQRVNLNGSLSTTGNPNNYIQNNNIVLASAPEACHSSVNSPYVTGSMLFSGTAGTPCLGSTGRNAFGGPGYATFDMALQKSFNVFGEGHSLIIRSEFYNLFNRANYYNPISAFSLDGITQNPQFGKVLSAHAPRQIQLAARFSW